MQGKWQPEGGASPLEDAETCVNIYTATEHSKERLVTFFPQLAPT